MFDTKIYNCIYNQNLIGKKSSVHYDSSFRLDRAREQLEMYSSSYLGLSGKQKCLNLIIEYTNSFLKEIGISPIENPMRYLEEGDLDNVLFYREIKKEAKLKSVSDIVWMKFTKEGLLGVVAVSNDINFEIPNSADYDAVTDKSHWQHNTSGILAHKLGLEWDESFVLIFPLKNIPSKLSRSDIECGIGNYLIEREIPIMDYYSHRF